MTEDKFAELFGKGRGTGSPQYLRLQDRLRVLRALARAFRQLGERRNGEEHELRHAAAKLHLALGVTEVGGTLLAIVEQQNRVIGHLVRNEVDGPPAAFDIYVRDPDH